MIKFVESREAKIEICTSPEAFPWSLKTRPVSDCASLFVVVGWDRCSKSIFRSSGTTEREREREEFSTDRGMENGRWRIARISERGGAPCPDKKVKKQRRHLFLQKFRAWGMTLVMQPPNTSTFSIVPLSSVLAAFYFAARAFSREIAPL